MTSPLPAHTHRVSPTCPSSPSLCPPHFLAVLLPSLHNSRPPPLHA
eukprot:CAMPEP_0183374886 /NCGR_PEP_ID=MMETSP0164_2-20130417/115729_1 /TAXON_ID=221442 /ORGANISM="Coccolithus pelagicus ssp braarudi, Strain PLY182g" /LENGTH=45 /DNA_ID= /DNA_START= /DNA_END= /DNA_ORIENTATION=